MFKAMSTAVVCSICLLFTAIGCKSSTATVKTDSTSSTVKVEAKGDKGDPIPPRPQPRVEYEIKRSEPEFIVE